MKSALSFLLSGLVLSSAPALAGEAVTNIPQVGTHYRALIIEKSINRQNVLAAYTKLDESCRFMTDRANHNSPLFDFYWLNNRSSYEALDSSMGSLIRGRLVVGTDSDRNSMEIELTDLKTMKHDLPSPNIVITAKRETLRRKCEVEATIEMGPSDRNSEVLVSAIYLEMGMMGGVNGITIIGKTKITGRSISRRFAAAGGW